MRIVIDARMYGPKHFTGIGRYTMETIQGLERIDHENEYVVLLGRNNFEEYIPAAANFRKLLTPYAHYSLAEQIFLPWRLYRLRPDLVHFVNFNHPLLYLGRHVTTIHDLTMVLIAPRRRPGIIGRLKLLKRVPAKLSMWWAIKFSRRIIVPTAFVRDEIVKRYRVPSERVIVIHQGVSITLTAEMTAPEPKPKKPYLFYQGTYYPHKNIERLIEAFAILARDRPELQLVLSGKSDYTYDAVRAQVADLGLSDRVTMPGYVTEAEASWLFENALAYVFPSLSEGFGLPGLEAMAHKTPVIAARASCLPEIFGEAAAYMNDPLSVAAIAADIEAVIGDDAQMKQLSSAGPKQVAQYSWEALSRETLEIYRALRRR